MTETLTDILTAIQNGAADDNLDAVLQAVKDRRDAAGRIKFLTVKVGATGRLANVRPRYLYGAPFTVAEKRQTNVGVTIDPEWLALHPEARGKWSGVVVCPPQMLELD